MGSTKPLPGAALRRKPSSALGQAGDIVAGQMRSINIAKAKSLIKKGDQLLGEAATIAA
ncbi:MAG TPA: hypothetical protein VMA72_23865 [Streptosporangiaceae bacterium]|nr:hypothetical protein [Streptosporangiaceae bacterium]